MGILYNQQPRRHMVTSVGDVLCSIREIELAMKESGRKFDEVLRVYEHLENKRRNDLFIDNGDAWDEQIAGIGEEIQAIARELKDSSIERISDSLLAISEQIFLSNSK